MIVKARELEQLETLLNDLKELKLKMPFAYELACAVREVGEKATEVRMRRQNIISKYAHRDENGQMKINEENGMVDIDPENIEATNSELTELFNEEIELKLKKIKIIDIKDLDLTVGQIETLIPLIEE